MAYYVHWISKGNKMEVVEMEVTEVVTEFDGLTVIETVEQE